MTGGSGRPKSSPPRTGAQARSVGRVLAWSWAAASGGEDEEGGRGTRPREAALPAQPRALQPGRRPRPPLQPRRRGGVSRDEPAPFIQEVKATSGSMKTNGEPGGKETPGRGSASGRPAAVGLLSLWRSRPPRPGPGMCEPARRGPRAPHGARRPGL